MKDIRVEVLAVLDGSEHDGIPFEDPRDVAATTDGFVVTDGTARRVIRYVFQGGVASSGEVIAESVATLDLRRPVAGPFGASIGEIGENSFPHAIAVTPDQHVLVSLVREGSGWVGEDSERILVLDRDLQLLGAFGTYSQEELRMGPIGSIKGVTGIACSGDGDVYLAEMWGRRVQVFRKPEVQSGRVLTTTQNWWGVFTEDLDKVGRKPGWWYTPVDVFIDEEERVVVVDEMSRNAHWFTLDGKGKRVWTLTDELESSPSAVVRIPTGELIWADRGRNLLSVMNSEGEELGHIGVGGMAPGEFLAPEGLDVTDSGEVLVADTGNRRVQVLKVEVAEAPSAREVSSSSATDAGVDSDASLASAREQEIELAKQFLAAKLGPNSYMEICVDCGEPFKNVHQIHRMSNRNCYWCQRHQSKPPVRYQEDRELLQAANLVHEHEQAKKQDASADAGSFWALLVLAAIIAVLMAFCG